MDKDVIEGLKPQRLWYYFYQISQIPRESKHEDKIVEYVIKVASKLGLEYKKDELGNVVVKKAATKGKENLPGVVLQGHLDMVCEKNKDVQHDFSKDPIKLVRKGDYIMADGTTLGADNGIGVAAMLALMESKDVVHPRLEFLFTVDEETGLTGASALKPGFIEGKYMINCDSEEDNALYIGCAGGKDTEIILDVEWEPKPADYVDVFLKIGGLKGGHSGLDIHLERGNAIKLMNRLLWHLNDEVDFMIFSIDGGSKHNAIPRESEVKISLKLDEVEILKDYVKKYEEVFLKELDKIEDSININYEILNTNAEKVFTKSFQKKLLNLLYSIPHGVIKRSQQIPDLVETSTNLATVKMNNGKVKIGTSQRSSVSTEIIDIANQVKACGLIAGAEVIQGAGYPGWTPNMNSEILQIVKRTYKELFREEPEVKAVHAGLECGIISEKYPGLDIVSFGPTIIGAHSPDEKVSIPSVEKFWKLITSVLNKV